MNQLTSHNLSMQQFIESLDSGDIEPSLTTTIDLDSIDLVMRECLPIEDMREAGSFFTGQELSTKLIRKFNSAICSTSVVVDPTCGAGNLLIEVSRSLGVEKKLSDTLEVWGKVLRGFDIHESFIEASKLRLIIEAISRGVEKDCSLEEALNFFPHILKRDVMLLSSKDFEKATHIVLNPPFCNWQSPNTRYWKKGKVNAAGVVYDHLLNLIPVKCEISAILPDVLRSGSRYDCWRDSVNSRVEANCEIFGRFSKKVDSDVFILSGHRHDSVQPVAWQKKHTDSKTLSDYFDVKIGPLVAYRDPLIGESYPFIHPKNAPAWSTIDKIEERRQFKGTVITPPVVVIRRTSSPSDRYRATAAIIKGKTPVAIENHLIVAIPKNKTLKSCRSLLVNLKSSETNNYLNDTIRLRHLTVGVVKNIPISKGFE